MEDWKLSIGRHAIATALESDEINVYVDDDVEIDWDDWSVEHVTMGDSGWIEVCATQMSTQSEMVSRARRNPPSKAHPAEYKNHDVEIELVVQVRWPEDNPLSGEVHGEMIQHGGKPTPPDPEPEPF